MTCNCSDDTINPDCLEVHKLRWKCKECGWVSDWFTPYHGSDICGCLVCEPPLDRFVPFVQNCPWCEEK